MFPSGVDLKLKRPKGSIFGKERQHLHPVDPGVRVCRCVCSCLPLGVDQGFSAGCFLQLLSAEPGITNFSGLAGKQASGIVLCLPQYYDYTSTRSHMTFCVGSRVSNSSLHEGVAKTSSAEPPVYSLLTLYIDTFPQSLLLVPHTLGMP